jgi:UDP-glucose:(heptosyl)LPS alpha-1,3-glucosyltransferase
MVSSGNWREPNGKTVMKVALVIDRFDPRRGGGEGYVVSLARGLKEKGHLVHVFASSGTSSANDIQLHNLPILHYPRWAKLLTLAVNARRTIEREQFDIVHGFGWVPHVDVYRPGGGVELAWLRRDILSRRHRKGWMLYAMKRIMSLKLIVALFLERKIFMDPKGPEVIANSRMVKEYMLEVYKDIDPGRIHVIHNGVDVTRFHPKNRNTIGRQMRRNWGMGQDHILILFMAHNFHLKGLHHLIGALGRLRDHPARWHLMVAGRGRRGPFERHAHRLGIGERVHFLDQVDRPEAAYAACDFLVHPTFYDPFSNVCLEAMASGLPVVTTAFNGAGELVREGVSGYVVSDPRAEEELSQRMEVLFRREIRDAMGEAARAEAEDHSLDIHTERVESVYRYIMEGRA